MTQRTAAVPWDSRLKARRAGHDLSVKNRLRLAELIRCPAEQFGRAMTSTRPTEVPRPAGAAVDEAADEVRIVGRSARPLAPAGESLVQEGTFGTAGRRSARIS